MARALKTFQAHLGFYDTVVAAPSQAAALKAWGSRRDLFREGFAKVCNDPAAIAAASAKPGQVLRRAAGSTAPYSENPALPQVPNLIKPAKPAPKKVAPEKRQAEKERPPPPRLVLAPLPPKPPKPVDRRPVEAAEKAIAQVKAEETRALAALEKRKAALSQEERRIREDFRSARERAEQKLADARRAYAAALNRR
jgi:hypothetical protein